AASQVGSRLAVASITKAIRPRGRCFFRKSATCLACEAGKLVIVCISCVPFVCGYSYDFARLCACVRNPEFAPGRLELLTKKSIAGLARTIGADLPDGSVFDAFFPEVVVQNAVCQRRPHVAELLQQLHKLIAPQAVDLPLLEYRVDILIQLNFRIE